MRRLLTKTADRIDLWLLPWAKWADKHGVPEMFWGLYEFRYANKNPRLLWLRFREHWFDPQQECIDYIDGYCVGHYDTPSRVKTVWLAFLERVVLVWFWEWRYPVVSEPAKRQKEESDDR